jgi:uncharacterized protein (TIGR02266 family)
MKDKEKRPIFKERRVYKRVPLDIWVEQQKDQDLYFQRSANLSVGGIYLEKTVPHPQGTIVTLSFTLPGDSQPIKTRGQIVNIPQKRNELGMGIKFIELSQEDKERIERFIQKAELKEKI